MKKAKEQTNYILLGVIYNWQAALTACPANWHLPGDEEWKQMEMALGMTQGQADGTEWRGIDQGTQMKTTAGWSGNGNGTNSSGFSGLPGGYYSSSGYFPGIGDNGFWWSSTEAQTNYAWCRYLDYRYTSVNRPHYYKGYGFSVRCVRNNPVK